MLQEINSTMYKKEDYEAIQNKLKTKETELKA